MYFLMFYTVKYHVIQLHAANLFEEIEIEIWDPNKGALHGPNKRLIGMCTRNIVLKAWYLSFPVQ